MSVLANHGIAMAGDRARHDAPVLRARQHRDPSRHGLPRDAVPRDPDPQVRGGGGQGGEADHLRPGPARRGRDRTPRKTRTSPFACTPSSPRGSPIGRGSSASIGKSRCPSCRSSPRWSGAGCEVDTERLRALSEELAVRMDALEREAHAEPPAARSTSSRRSRSRRSCSTRTGSGSRSGRRPRPASRPPRTRCSRTSPGSSPCPASSSTTAPSRSSVRPTRSRSGRA